MGVCRHNRKLYPTSTWSWKMNQKIYNIPKEIQKLNNFVLWVKTLKNNKEGKRPYDWRKNDGWGEGNDSLALQLPLEIAIKKVIEKNNPNIGLAIYQPSQGNQITVDEQSGFLYILDLDGFICEINGQIELLELGWEIIELCNNSYTEISPSNRGIKIFIVSDLKPTTKQVFPLPPNKFHKLEPNIVKYSESHAVEVFSKNFWNCITGNVWEKSDSNLKFIDSTQMKKIFSLLSSKSLKPTEVIPKEKSITYEKNTHTLNFSELLAKIDNQSEQTWNDVAYSLARIYGEEGKEIYVNYSEGKYNGQPCPTFDKTKAEDRFNRALKETKSNPNGYGLTKLCEMAGVDVNLIKQSLIKDDGQKIKSNDGITAEQLSQKIFQPLSWVVQDILPEGAYLISARPKVGKSWLALQICLGVAFGTPVLGKQVTKGKAVYLALEDNQRRLQARLNQLRPQGYSTPDLILHTSWPRFDNGGIEKIIHVIETENPKLIVIDTLAKVRPPVARGAGIYEADYKALAPITTVANQYRCTILIVTHNRKGKSEGDPLEQVSGSLGLSGAVDGVFVIDGNRGDKTYSLTLIGRDIPSDEDLAISLMPNGEWQLLGQAKQVFISEERRQIVDLLKLKPNGMKPKEIAETLGKKHSAVRKLLLSMHSEMQLCSNNGIYTHPSGISNLGNYLVQDA